MMKTKTPSGVTDNNEITLWSVARLLLGKFYWLLISGFACALIVWLITTFLIAPTYESRVSFYVYNNAEKSNHASTINNSDLQAAESLATTYSTILESNSVLDAVLKDLGDKSDLSRKDLSKMIEVSVVSDTQLLEVVIKSNSAEFACDVGKSFANLVHSSLVNSFSFMIFTSI